MAPIKKSKKATKQDPSDVRRERQLKKTERDNLEEDQLLAGFDVEGRFKDAPDVQVMDHSIDPDHVPAVIQPRNIKLEDLTERVLPAEKGNILTNWLSPKLRP